VLGERNKVALPSPPVYLEGKGGGKAKMRVGGKTRTNTGGVRVDHFKIAGMLKNKRKGWFHRGAIEDGTRKSWYSSRGRGHEV